MTTETDGARRAHGDGEAATLRRYEMWVRTVLSPAVVASFPVRAEPIRVPRNRVRRLQVSSDRDLPAVVRRLAESGIEVLELRVVAQCA